jgi:hypothetical protein
LFDFASKRRASEAIGLTFWEILILSTFWKISISEFKATLAREAMDCKNTRHLVHFLRFSSKKNTDAALATSLETPHRSGAPPPQ